jgi:hypothetical protein
MIHLLIMLSGFLGYTICAFKLRSYRRFCILYAIGFFCIFMHQLIHINGHDDWIFRILGDLFLIVASVDMIIQSVSSKS